MVTNAVTATKRMWRAMVLITMNLAGFIFFISTSSTHEARPFLVIWSTVTILSLLVALSGGTVLYKLRGRS